MYFLGQVGRTKIIRDLECVIRSRIARFLTPGPWFRLTNMYWLTTMCQLGGMYKLLETLEVVKFAL